MPTLIQSHNWYLSSSISSDLLCYICVICTAPDTIILSLAFASSINKAGLLQDAVSSLVGGYRPDGVLRPHGTRLLLHRYSQLEVPAEDGLDPLSRLLTR